MSKKKYRPKLNQQGKSAQHKPADSGADGNGKLHQFPNVNDSFEARKQSILDVVNRYNADKEAAARQAEAAHATAEKAAKVIAEEGKAEEARRAAAASGNGQAKEDAAKTSADPLDDWLAGLTDEELKAWRAHGEDLLEKLRFRMGGVSAFGSGALTDTEVSEFLGNGVRFLNQVVVLTSHVLDTIDVEYTRKVVAHDSQPMDIRHALKALGYDPDKVLGAESGGGSQESGEKTGDHRKLPRGRRHPLLQLIALGASAVRLMNRITRGTNPHAHNLLTQQERLDERESFRPPLKLDLSGL